MKLEDKVNRLEGRIESLERMVDRLVLGQGHQVQHEDMVKAILPRLTAKQHVALQMIMLGCSNAQIAKRFNVTENTAKVHVRGIARKYRVSTRSQIVMAAVSEWDSVTSNQYLLMSGGIPKDWGETYGRGPITKDPHSKIYRS
jgi:DNA-binding CsgD family transcriptional regulator